MARERVYTINDWYDGPRNGVADFRGRPHVYLCLWDKEKDEWSDEYLLNPIDNNTFESVIRDWQDWRRWETQFHSGKVSQESHPGQSEDMLKILDISEVARQRCHAKFYPLDSPEVGIKDMEVEWQDT